MGSVQKTDMVPVRYLGPDERHTRKFYGPGEWAGATVTFEKGSVAHVPARIAEDVLLLSPDQLFELADGGEG